MQHEAQHPQRLLAALGDPSRFRIVLELSAKERHVSDLAETIGLSQSCTTRHLQALERAGLVRTRRAGKRVMASLEAGEAAAGLLDWVRSRLGIEATEEPGRTGGKDARHEVPQDAPPRQDPAHARAAKSGTPPPATSEPPAPRPWERQDMEDFLL
jgi:DNA-binding transcriptional ArsR family regulator